jgi:hypothetical protein
MAFVVHQPSTSLPTRYQLTADLQRSIFYQTGPVLHSFTLLSSIAQGAKAVAPNGWPGN